MVKGESGVRVRDQGRAVSGADDHERRRPQVPHLQHGRRAGLRPGTGALLRRRDPLRPGTPAHPGDCAACWPQRDRGRLTRWPLWNVCGNA